MKNASKPKVVVLGGGFGGLEAGRYARQRLPRTGITLVSDKEYFLFKPNSIYVPFGLEPAKLMFRLAGPTRRENIRFTNARVREIDPISRRIYLEDSDEAFNISYDFLVVATGANMRPNEIPGLSEFGTTVSTPDEMLKLRTALHKIMEEVRDSDRERRKVLFLVSPHNKYAGPLYEMTMLLDSRLRRKRIRPQVEIAFATYEESYIQAFGPRLHNVVTSEFRTREIAGHTSFVIDRVEPGLAAFANGEELPFDLLIAFPPYSASAGFSALPTDERGFIATELATRQVVGYPDVYAVGDAADYPLKQAFMAFLQADAAAEHLSASILGVQPALSFDQISPIATEDLDKAKLAHLLAKLGGHNLSPNPAAYRHHLNSMEAISPMNAIDPEKHLAHFEQLEPFDLAPTPASGGYGNGYGNGYSPLWMLARKMIGAYLPWRFKADNPFHEDAPWKGMEMGLRLVPGLPLH